MWYNRLDVLKFIKDRILLKMNIILHENDISLDFIKNLNSVAIDTETMGLKPHRDRLCLIQLCDSNENCHLVKMKRFDRSPNLRRLFLDEKILKIFHYARFDVMMIYKYLGVMTKNIYCTKIASKLSRTYTSSHSLQRLCEELLNVSISKEQTCTDWGRDNLLEEQKIYAANDVLYLHKIKDKLDIMLKREDRLDLAQKCFNFLEARVLFDLMAGETYDIFAHHGE